ncbi:MAG: SDR family oxidoreductase [Gammaproteobacteria bacterium]
MLSGLIYPEDVAGLVSYLVSDHSNKITGQVIRIDRGLPF